MDLEQDDWIDNQQGSNTMDLDGNQKTHSMSIQYIDAFTRLHTTQADSLHRLCLFRYRTRGGTRCVQEGSDVLLRPGAAKRHRADRRRAGGAAEEAHRHHRVANMEEHLQCQRHHPPVCCCFLSWFFRLKKLNLAQLLLDAVIYI